jgi:parallel beta-helix repeat protein
MERKKANLESKLTHNDRYGSPTNKRLRLLNPSATPLDNKKLRLLKFLSETKPLSEKASSQQIKKILFMLSIMIITMLHANNAGAAALISNCTNLSVADETYLLTQNNESEGTCFDIAADNITLDCQGYNITFCTVNQDDYFAVNNIGGYDGVTIKNCNFFQAEHSCRAIFFQDATNGNIMNNSITIYNYGYGVYLHNTSNTNITGNYIIANGDESNAAQPNIYLYTSNDNIIKNNTLIRGTENIVLYESKNASLYNNTLTNPEWHSISVSTFYYDPSYYNHAIGEDNTLNGKSIKYIANINDTAYRDLDWSDYDVIVANVNNVTFTNLTLSGISFTNDYMNGELSNSNITSTSTCPLQFHEFSDSGIENNFLVKDNIISYDQNNYAVTLAESIKNITFINNTITATGSFTAFMQGAGGSGGGCDYSLYNNTINATDTRGMEVYPGEAPLILKGNTIVTGGTDNIGIYVYGSCEAIYLSNTNITSSGQSIYAYTFGTSNSQIILVNDSILNSTGGAEIYIGPQTEIGYMNLSNVTLAHNNITFEPTSIYTVNVRWYLDANVTDDAGNPITSANVTVKDKDSVTDYNGLTSIIGAMGRQAITQYSANTTTNYYYSNHTVNATKHGYSSNQTNINFTTNKQISLTLSGETMSINISVLPSTAKNNQLINILGYLNDSNGQSIPDHDIYFYINTTQYTYNPATGRLEPGTGYNKLTTDSNGNYNYTFTAPSIAGNYLAKINTTNIDYSAQANASLTVQQYYINVSLTLNQSTASPNASIRITGHINDSDGNNLTNQLINIYINDTMINITETSGWWNLSWEYRTKINITSLVTNNLNYAVALVNLSTSSLITAGKMNSDCGDVRFVDNNSNELNYTLETSTCDTTNTLFWVWSNLTGNANNTIYAYYGNSAASLKTGYANSDTGLILYMHFDNSSAYGETSSKTYDFSKNGRNGSCNNCPTWTSSGRYGGAYSFDGANDYINTATLGSGMFSSDSTISVWVKSNVDTGSYTNILSQGIGGEALWQLGFNGGQWVFYGNDVSSAMYSDYITAGLWYHIVIVQNETNLYMYVNGTQVDSDPVSTTGNGEDLNIGSMNQNDYFFNGTIDEIRVYNRALSPDEIAAMYNSTSTNYIDNQTRISTDSSGNYNYTFNASSTAGNYQIKVNTTYNNNIGENTATLRVGSDSCSCPGTGTDWLIDMADSCNITSNCDLTTGYLNFTGAGYVRFNATVSCTNMQRPGSGQIIYIHNNGLIYVS